MTLMMVIFIGAQKETRNKRGTQRANLKQTLRANMISTILKQTELFHFKYSQDIIFSRKIQNRLVCKWQKEIE